MGTLDVQTILAEMESLGTEQARKTYKRHGIGDNQFGMSYSNYGKLQKRIKTNHALAIDLWNSGIHDGQILAYMIADPLQADPDTLDKWAYASTNYTIAAELGVYVAKTPLAQAKSEVWMQSDNEYVSTTGWNILGTIATNDISLPDAYFVAHLATIERDLHGSKNWVRYAMNNALIAIGARNPALQAAAVAMAERMGKVEVDHGLTYCKTPDAIIYIQKAVDHKLKMAASNAVRKSAKRAVKA